MPTFAKGGIGKEGDGFPRGPVPAGTFGDEHMDVRIPLQIAAKGMKAADQSRSKEFLLVLAVEPRENGGSGSLKQ